MIIQYADCLPFVKIDLENHRLYVNGDVDWGTSLAELNENIEDERYENFSLTNRNAAGFFRFLDNFMKTAEATGSIVSDIFAAAWDNEPSTTRTPARGIMLLYFAVSGICGYRLNFSVKKK